MKKIKVGMTSGVKVQLARSQQTLVCSYIEDTRRKHKRGFVNILKRKKKPGTGLKVRSLKCLKICASSAFKKAQRWRTIHCICRKLKLKLPRRKKKVSSLEGCKPNLRSS